MKTCNLNSTVAHVDLVVNFQLDLVILILYVCFYINIHLVILIYEILWVLKIDYKRYQYRQYTRLTFKQNIRLEMDSIEINNINEKIIRS